MNVWKVTTIALAVALGVTIGGSAIQSAGAEPQPRMRAALVHLRAAKNDLEKASHDKGGHRVKAIALVNEAMLEVQKGIDYDDKH